MKKIFYSIETETVSAKKIKYLEKWYESCFYNDNVKSERTIEPVYDYTLFPNLEDAKKNFSKYKTEITFKYGRYYMSIYYLKKELYECNDNEKYRENTIQSGYDWNLVDELDYIQKSDFPIEYTSKYKEIYSDLEKSIYEYLDEIEANYDTKAECMIADLLKKYTLLSMENNKETIKLSQFIQDLKQCIR